MHKHLTTEIKKAIADSAGMVDFSAWFGKTRNDKWANKGRSIKVEVKQPLNKHAFNNGNPKQREHCCNLVKRRVRAWYKANGKKVPTVSVFAFYRVEVFIFE